jgi:hypothetical protein
MEIARQKIATVWDGNLRAAEKAFQKKFPGSDMNSMVHLGEHYWVNQYRRDFFLLDNLRIVGIEDFEYEGDFYGSDEDEADDMRPNHHENVGEQATRHRVRSFFEIKRFRLSTKGATCIHSDETYTKTNVKLVEDDGIITYELYPFQQGQEMPLELLLKVLGLDEAEVEPLETRNADSYDRDPCLCRVDGATTIHVSDDQVYSVHRNCQTVSEFEGPDYEYQLGDSDTRCFYVGSKAMLIIENRGDVSSMVIVNFNEGVILM